MTRTQQVSFARILISGSSYGSNCSDNAYVYGAGGVQGMNCSIARLGRHYWLFQTANIVLRLEVGDP